MNLDMSVAPEIARLAAPLPRQAAIATGVGGVAARATIGALASELRGIAGHPELWWGSVRFTPGRSFKIDLEGFWVMTLAPEDPGVYCGCEVMTVVAGSVIEESVADGGAVATTLQRGRIRVHGQGQVHQIRVGGDGFAVSLHVGGGARHQPHG
jgi:hypothetical protein